MNRHFLNALALGALLGSSLWVGGCASHTGDSIANDLNGKDSYLHFRLSVNPSGTIDRSGKGYYVVLLNAKGEEIEVTNTDTFTDFIRYDGVNFDWYTRQANQPNPGWTFALAGSLNTEGTVSTDGNSIDVTFNLAEASSLLHQYIVTRRFTAHALTTDTDQDAILGRVIDFMGDSLDGCSLQTVVVDKLLGATRPYPTFYPNDRLNDWITHSDLDSNFPYVNFDIDTLEIYNSDTL